MQNAWHGDEIAKKLQAELGKNIEKACIHLKEQIKMAVNRSQPYDIYHGNQGTWYKGLDPSLPDEPPKKIRGDLQRSIVHEMSGDKLTGRVGSNIDYAKFNELGTSKQAARPFIRPTIDRERTTISRIVATGRK